LAAAPLAAKVFCGFLIGRPLKGHSSAILSDDYRG
jgi:hypothetical protein